MDRSAAAQCALLAYAAERMTDKGDVPPLDPSVVAEWCLEGHITAANALFNGQQIGLGAQCYYGFIAFRRSNPGEVVVVLRGTESSLEWMEDAEAAFVPTARAGLAHAGFWSIYCSMRYGGDYAAAAIARRINTIQLDGAIGLATPIQSVTVIGHSLGAALASYLMADIRAASPSFAVRGALFASPKPGDANLAHWIDSTVGRDNYEVFNFSRDIVPRLPFGLPFGFGFQPLPNVIWLTPSMSSAKIPDGAANAHSLLTYAALLQGVSLAA